MVWRASNKLKKNQTHSPHWYGQLSLIYPWNRESAQNITMLYFNLYQFQNNMNQRIALICLTTLLLGVSLTLAKEDKEKTYSKNRTDKSIKVNGKDMTRKSIVFDKDTPDVFYCIPNKPTGEDKIIVR